MTLIALLMPLTRTGVEGFDATPPSPIAPLQDPPQHLMVPSARFAQAVLVPTETPRAVVMPLTCTGMLLSTAAPFPSIPSVPQPQHQTVPSFLTAQLVWAPCETLAAFVNPLTSTGTLLLTKLLLPSCPLLLLPQHLTVLSESTAQAPYPSRMLTLSADEIEEILVGKVLPVQVPSPEFAPRPQHQRV